MNPTLRFAQKEIQKIKNKDKSEQIDHLVISLEFNHNEESMKALWGYPSFAKALEELGGERTEENILKACEISGLNRASVLYDDNDDYEPILITIPLPKSAL